MVKPPTHRKIGISLVMSYEIENGKIVHTLVIIDQMTLMEQLGVMNVEA